MQAEAATCLFRGEDRRLACPFSPATRDRRGRLSSTGQLRRPLAACTRHCAQPLHDSRTLKALKSSESVDRRLLVVDDDVAIRVLLSRMLLRASYDVDVAKDGAQAIEQILLHPYDVIVLDLMMPRVDGIGVVKYLTEHQPDVLKKVIVTTAFGAKALTKVCPPVARFLEKPFDVERLMREITECAWMNGS